MRSEDWDRVGKARESLDAAPLFIDESPENTVMDIVAKNRGGETGTATLVNQLHYGKFGNFKRDFA